MEKVERLTTEPSKSLDQKIIELIDKSVTCGPVRSHNDRSLSEWKSELDHINSLLKPLNKKHRDKSISFGESLQRQCQRINKRSVENAIHALEWKAEQQARKARGLSIGILEVL